MKSPASPALRRMLRLAPWAALAAIPAALLFSQAGSGQGSGHVERIKVHAKSLEGNLEGDSPEREVLIYLPASYQTSANRRYPVVYMLHGFTDDPDHWWGFRRHFISIPAVLDRAFSDGATREMILAMPNAYTAYQGSMYSNSITTGDWEDFVAKELVAYIDTHYRTIPQVASRGLSGHSMGGYGALKIGMKHPEVYSSLYVLSPCCLSAPVPQQAARLARAEAVRSPAEVAKADFGTKAALAEAAAWSPNPKNSPLFLDLPTKDGVFQPEIAAKWAANTPLALVDQYISNLRRMRALAFDVGLQDGLAADVRILDKVLSDYSLPHIYETYEGDHLNRVAERVQTKVMPFFSKNLSFEQPRH